MITVALDWTGYIVAVVVMLELATRIVTRWSTNAASEVKGELAESSLTRWLTTTAIAGTAALAVFIVPRLLESATMHPWSAPLKEPVFYSIVAALTLVFQRSNGTAKESALDKDPRQTAMKQLDSRLEELIDRLDYCTSSCINTQMLVQQSMSESKDLSGDHTTKLRKALMSLEQELQGTMAALSRQDANVDTEMSS